VSEVVDSRLKRAAIAVSETLDYERAAELLHISVADLRARILELESRLCIHIFEPGRSELELTMEGRVLVTAFREWLASRNQQ